MCHISSHKSWRIWANTGGAVELGNNTHNLAWFDRCHLLCKRWTLLSCIYYGSLSLMHHIQICVYGVSVCRACPVNILWIIVSFVTGSLYLQLAHWLPAGVCLCITCDWTWLCSVFCCNCVCLRTYLCILIKVYSSGWGLVTDWQT